MGKKSFIYLNLIFRFLLHRYYFSCFLKNASLPCRLRKAYGVLWPDNHFVGSETPKHNSFDQFRKFEFHLEYFPRNTQFVSFDGPSNYFHLFKFHRQSFSSPGERPSFHINVTKTWFGPNIQYLSKLYFADFCCRGGISCFEVQVRSIWSFYTGGC